MAISGHISVAVNSALLLISLELLKILKSAASYLILVVLYIACRSSFKPVADVSYASIKVNSYRVG